MLPIGKHKRKYLYNFNECTMNRFEFLEKLVILEKLIRQGHTGTPDEIAERLSISRGTVYNIIEELNLQGVEIKYSRSRCTFYYKNDVFLDIYFNIKYCTTIDDPEELKNISGGCKFFPSVQFFIRKDCTFAVGNTFAINAM